MFVLKDENGEIISWSQSQFSSEWEEVKDDNYEALSIPNVGTKFLLKNSDEWQQARAKITKFDEIERAHVYLESTDYITAKIAEVADNVAAVAALREKYSEQLEVRKQARAIISQLEG